MAFDFPAAPTENQIFTPPGGGQSYIYNAPVWKFYGSSGIPAGAVMHFAMQTAPVGWLKADGALVSRTGLTAALFAAIGTIYGAGDGSTTFKLPDLRGEFIRAWDDARGIDLSRGFGSAQADGTKTHDHTWSATTSGHSANHTHAATGLTMGTESVDHTHTVAVSGTTAGVSANHTHTFSDTSSATGTGSANHAHEPSNVAYSFLTQVAGSGTGVAITSSSQVVLAQASTNSLGAAHTHTVAVSGTTGANSVSHTHTFSDAASSTGGRSAGHTHAMTGATAAASVDHTHSVSGTTVANVGGTTETRPRNIAMLACIKI